MVNQSRALTDRLLRLHNLNRIDLFNSINNLSTLSVVDPKKDSTTITQHLVQAGLTYIESEDGLLDTVLTVVKGPARVGGMMVANTVTFDGLYPGPTLVMRRGDRIRILLRNELEDSEANIHFHGFHVTPEGSGDNMRIRVPPGGAFQYDFVIPANQDEGLFWLHGHVFGLSDHHVSLGLSSLLVVDGGAADLLRDKRRVLMAINEMQISDDGRAVYPPTTPTWEHTYTINGEIMPVFMIRPGETQFWQLANIGANTYLRLQVEAHDFTVLEVDGGLLYNTYRADDLFLYQARRMGVAITASNTAGDYTIRTLGWDGGVFNNYTATDLAILRVEGPTVPDQTPPAIPAHPRRPNDARFVPSDQVAAYRTFILSENGPTAPVPEFYINSMLFSDRTPEWTPQAVVDTTEEWLIAVSNSPTQLQDPHVWHVHTNPFAIVGQGEWDYREGVRSLEQVAPNGTQDVINIEPGTYVVLRTHLADFPGRPVMHCHLLL